MFFLGGGDKMDQSNAAYFSQEQQVVEKDKQYKIHKERD